MAGSKPYDELKNAHASAQGDAERAEEKLPEPTRPVFKKEKTQLPHSIAGTRRLSEEENEERRDSRDAKGVDRKHDIHWEAKYRTNLNETDELARRQREASDARTEATQKERREAAGPARKDAQTNAPTQSGPGKEVSDAKAARKAKFREQWAESAREIEQGRDQSRDQGGGRGR